MSSSSLLHTPNHFTIPWTFFKQKKNIDNMVDILSLSLEWLTAELFICWMEKKAPTFRGLKCRRRCNVKDGCPIKTLLAMMQKTNVLKHDLAIKKF